MVWCLSGEQTANVKESGGLVENRLAFFLPGLKKKEKEKKKRLRGKETTYFQTLRLQSPDSTIGAATDSPSPCSPLSHHLFTDAWLGDQVLCVRLFKKVISS